MQNHEIVMIGIACLHSNSCSKLDLPMEEVHNSALTWLGCSRCRDGKWAVASTTLKILLTSSTPHLKSRNFHRHWSLSPPSSSMSLHPTIYWQKWRKLDGLIAWEITERKSSTSKLLPEDMTLNRIFFTHKLKFITKPVKSSVDIYETNLNGRTFQSSTFFCSILCIFVIIEQKKHQAHRFLSRNEWRR